MGRTKIEVDKSIFVSAVEKAESNTTFNTWLDMSRAVADILKSEYSTDISPAVVLLRIKEFNVIPKTPKGKRGRQAGIKLTTEHKEAMLKGRRNRGRVENAKELQQYFPQTREKLVNRAVTGSLKSCIALKCLDCCGFSTTEIKSCDIKSCSLWAFRPYK